MRGAVVAALVLSGHAAVFAAISQRPVSDTSAVLEPMMVSLVEESAPMKSKVQARPQPVQPKPSKVEPAVKQQPQPIVQPKTEPVPATVQAEAAPHTKTQAEPSQPQQEKIAEAVPNPEPAAQVAKEVPAEAEPVFQPPRFGVSYLRNPSPEYPPISRRLKEQGKVMLRVMVTAMGEPAAIEVDKSSGFERLDQAAIEAVKQWRFVAAKRGEQAVNAWVLVPLSFSVKG